MKVLVLDDVKHDGMMYILLSHVESIRLINSTKKMEIAYHSGKIDVVDIDDIDNAKDTLDFMRDNLGV